MKKAQRPLDLAGVLLCTIAWCHFLYDPLSQYFDNPPAAAKALFYILRGIEGTILFLIIGIGVLSPPKVDKRMVLPICLYGAFEEAQTAVCRISKGIDSHPNYTIFNGLCGKGWYQVGLAITLTLALMLLDRGKIK